MRKILLIPIAIVFVFTACITENTKPSTDENQATKDSLLRAKSQEVVEEEFKDFVDFELLKEITITKETKEINLDSIVFKSNWNEKYAYSSNLERYIGGINELKIYKGKDLVQTIDSVKDEDALGEINIRFADFNFDGYLDFTLPLGYCGKSCYFKYFLYSPLDKKYINVIDWDKIRIQSVNRQKKLIRTVMEGTCCEGEFYIMQTEGLKLLEIKKIEIK